MTSMACWKSSPVCLVPVVEDAETERFGQRQRHAGTAGIVTQQAIRVRDPGDGHPVLGLRVVDAVAAADDAARSRSDVEPAAQHLAGDAERHLLARPARAG